jgi:hypothetical protein
VVRREPQDAIRIGGFQALADPVDPDLAVQIDHHLDH